MPKQLDEVYTEQLRNHPEGHALYTKVQGSSMSPGSCGYFTETSQWREIVRLGEVEPAKLAAEGWKAPSRALKVFNDSGIKWPMKLSESVNGHHLGLDAKARCERAISLD